MAQNHQALRSAVSTDSRTTSTSATKDYQKNPVVCKEVPAAVGSSYAAPFLQVVKSRSKHKLGKFFGLQNFGIKYTTLAPGASSALQHHQAKQDEFVVVLEGTATLHLGKEKHLMQLGKCMGFPAGQGTGHHCVVNKSTFHDGRLSRKTRSFFRNRIIPARSEFGPGEENDQRQKQQQQQAIAKILLPLSSHHTTQQYGAHP